MLLLMLRDLRLVFGLDLLDLTLFDFRLLDFCLCLRVESLDETDRL